MFKNCVEPNGKTHFVECVQRISQLLGKALIGNQHKIFLTSKDWALLTGEIVREHKDSFTDPTKMPTPENFKSAEVGGVLFVNSGTDDEDHVNRMNIECYRFSSAPELVPSFQHRRDNFIVGKV